VWNQKNISIVDEIYSPNFIHYDPSNPTAITGVEGIKKRVAQVIKAFPDVHFNVEDMIAEGDKVVVYC
jgi:predicted ester cyclase